MQYVVELDPKHRVLRATFGPSLTDAVLEEAYHRVRGIAFSMGQVRGIADFTAVTEFDVTPQVVRKLAQGPTAIPEGNARVVVAISPVVFGMSRLFQITRDGMGGELHVVESLEQAYLVLGGEPYQFTERL